MNKNAFAGRPIQIPTGSNAAMKKSAEARIGITSNAQASKLERLKTSSTLISSAKNAKGIPSKMTKAAVKNPTKK